MARKPRVHAPGCFYHVLLRGNGGDDVFFCRDDRTKFLTLLQEGIKRYSYRLHAFCLMTNHIHMIIQVGEVPLSKIVHNVSFRYTRSINKRKKRSGHLFQGRYTAILIDADNYMLELVRYIHNNPVRAKLVTDPVDYPWSTHAAYIGLKKVPFVTISFVLGQFGKSLPAARRHYLDFIHKRLNEERREEFYDGRIDGRILGNDTFAETILSKKLSGTRPQLHEIASYVCNIYKIDEHELRLTSRRRDYSQARGVIGWLAMELGSTTLTDVAAMYNRDLTTLSRAAKRIADKALTSKKYRDTLRGYLDDLRGEIVQ